MHTDLLQGLAGVILIALAGLGWAGYWTEFQHRIKLEKKVKQFYGE